MVTVAHTPDPDDAFMYFGLTSGAITPGFKIKWILKDIETLNRYAFEYRYDVTAVSYATYEKIRDKYEIIPYGASVGYCYGPKVVSTRKIEFKDIKSVVCPGVYTTAHRVFSEFLDAKHIHVNFLKIMRFLKKYDAGILIHDMQIDFKKYGVYEVCDLGSMWYKKYKKPLVLGVNVIKKTLPQAIKKEFADLLKKSIYHAYRNFTDAVNYAMNFSRTDFKTTARFIKMYVSKKALLTSS